MYKKLLSVLIGTVVCLPVQAELIPGTVLSLDFQSAQVQAGGRTVKMFHVPVTDTVKGVTTLYDAEFLFEVQTDGTIGFTRVTSAVASTSQIHAADNFIAGTYRDSAGTLYAVTGPAALPAGRYEYSINAITSGKQWTASWITGPIKSNPLFTESNTYQPQEGSAGAFGKVGANNYALLYGSVSSDDSGYPLGATQQSPTTIVLTAYDYHNAAAKFVTLTKN